MSTLAILDWAEAVRAAAIKAATMSKRKFFMGEKENRIFFGCEQKITGAVSRRN
jgi:hypothetical protein